jgi:hypothetical protein
MGLNPYFNESHSNLDFHEVAERIDNNSNVYERSTAHWYAIANARNIGKPLTFAARSAIFETSRPGQLQLPDYVDPLAYKWTNYHRTNEAIVGSDNVLGEKLNYENWHQGLGLTSTADERYIASIRGVQHTARIQNLKDLDLGSRIPDVRRFQNTKASKAIVNAVRKLRADLESSTYLPADDEIPTEEQLQNIETFKREVGVVSQAYQGFTYGDVEERDAIKAATQQLLTIDQRSIKRTKYVGSALANFARIVAQRPVEPQPVTGQKPPQVPEQEKELLTFPQPDIFSPFNPTSAPPPASAPVPNPTPSAPAPTESAPPSAQETAPPAAPTEIAEPTPAALPAPPMPPAPPAPPTPPTWTFFGDILHLSPEEIEAIPPEKFEATINELKAMDTLQFDAFCWRYDELNAMKQLKLYLRKELWAKPFYELRHKREVENTPTTFNKGNDYYGENVGPFDFFSEPILKREDQRHRKGGVGPRRGSVSTASAAVKRAVAEAGLAGLSVEQKKILTEAVVKATTELNDTAAAKVAAATAKSIKRQEKRAAALPPDVQSQRTTQREAVGASAKVAKSALSTVSSGLMGALGTGAMMIAAGGGPSSGDYQASEQILTPLIPLTEKFAGSATALGVGAVGTLALPGLLWFSRSKMALWSVKAVCDFIAGNGRSSSQGIMAGIYSAYTSQRETMAQESGDHTVQMTIQKAVNKGKESAATELLPEIENAANEAQKKDIRKRFNLKAPGSDKSMLADLWSSAASYFPNSQASQAPAQETTPGVPPFMPKEPQPTEMPTTETPMSAEPTPAGPESKTTEPPEPSRTPGPQPQARPRPVPHGGVDNRHERDDFTKEEKKAQKRIKESHNAMAEELESDEEAMDGEGGVLENKTDVISSMAHSGNHRVPEGYGEKMPVLYGGVATRGDIPDDDADLLGEAFAHGLFMAMDYTDRGIPFEPEQLGVDAYTSVLTESLEDSSEDRLIVAPKEAAHAPPTEDTYLNFPTTSEPTPEPILAPMLEGGGLHGGGYVKVADLKAGQKYTFKMRDIPFEFIGTVRTVELQPPHPVAVVFVNEVLQGTKRKYNDFRVIDEIYQIKDDIKQSEKHAAEALGRVHTGIPATAIGNIAEFLGHKGAIGDLERAEVADKGRPGDIPSILRPREETGLAPVTQKRALTEAAEPASKRQKQGGEKPKRKVSEWSLLIQKVFKELRETNPDVTIAMAAKEASRRRKSAT